MTMNYSNNETNNRYHKDNVKCITFVGGILTVLYEDNAGKIQHLSYSKESMENGVLSIF